MDLPTIAQPFSIIASSGLMKPDNRKNSLDMPDFLVVQALLLFSLALSVQTDPKAAAVTCSCSSKAVGSASFTFCVKKKKSNPKSYWNWNFQRTHHKFWLNSRMFSMILLAYFWLKLPKVMFEHLFNLHTLTITWQSNFICIWMCHKHLHFTAW